jgi:outer membrane protein W
MRTQAITLIVLTIVLVLIPITGLCQAKGIGVPPARVDVSATLGVFSASHKVSEEECCNWSTSLFKGLGAGYYWTEHLKTEIEAAWPGRSETYTYSNSRSADGTVVYINEEHSYNTFNASAAQLYQFGRNAFFHPFAGAGLGVTREHDKHERTTATNRGPQSADVSETSAVRARPFVTTGFKAYFAERAFFRGEVKLGLARRVEELVWKAGFGVDF